MSSKLSVDYLVDELDKRIEVATRALVESERASYEAGAEFWAGQVASLKGMRHWTTCGRIGCKPCNDLLPQSLTLKDVV